MVTVFFVLVFGDYCRLAQAVGSFQGIQCVKETTILLLFILILSIFVIFLFARSINLVEPLPKVKDEAAQMQGNHVIKGQGDLRPCSSFTIKRIIVFIWVTSVIPYYHSNEGAVNNRMLGDQNEGH